MGGTVPGEHGVGSRSCRRCASSSRRREGADASPSSTPSIRRRLNPGKVIPTMVRCAIDGKMHVSRGLLASPTAALLRRPARSRPRRRWRRSPRGSAPRRPPHGAAHRAAAARLLGEAPVGETLDTAAPRRRRDPRSLDRAGRHRAAGCRWPCSRRLAEHGHGWRSSRPTSAPAATVGGWSRPASPAARRAPGRCANHLLGSRCSAGPAS